MGPSGLIALLAGWFTTELGRQPWVIYGLMKTADAGSNHSTSTIVFSLVLLVVVYGLIFGTGIRYLLRLISRGPDQEIDTTLSTIRPTSPSDTHLGD